MDMAGTWFYALKVKYRIRYKVMRCLLWSICTLAKSAFFWIFLFYKALSCWRMEEMDFWKIWAWFKERNRSSASGELDRGMRGSWVQGFFHCFTLVSLQFLPLLASFLMFMHPKVCVLEQFQSPKSPKSPHSEAREKEQVFLCLIPKLYKACWRNFIEVWGPDGVLINQDQGTT